MIKNIHLCNFTFGVSRGAGEAGMSGPIFVYNFRNDIFFITTS